MSRSRISNKTPRPAATVRRTAAFPIVISGPSGAGKTTLVGRMLEEIPGLGRSVSVTTRSPRENEIDGQAYRFVDQAAFHALRESELVEWAEVHGQWYGTPREYLEKALGDGCDVVLNIDVQGARRVKKQFPGAVMIFILPPSFEELERRIRGRSADQGREIARRLENARTEMQAISEFDYVVINDDIERAAAALAAIVLSERCRRQRYPRNFLENFE